MSDSSQSGLSSPHTTSTPPSPALSTLSLQDVTEEAKEHAGKIKAEANKAFTSARP